MYADIVIIAIIALILIIKLISILGRKEDNETIVSFVKQGDSTIITLNDNMSPVKRLKFVDPTFSEQKFIDGAKGAISMILDGFARGDTQLLSNLVGLDVLKQLALVISKREELGEVCTISDIKIVEIMMDNIEIVSNNYVDISVRFEAEMIAYLRSNLGKIILGHDQKIAKLSDIWVFRRDLHGKRDDWKLIKFGSFPLI